MMEITSVEILDGPLTPNKPETEEFGLISVEKHPEFEIPNYHITTNPTIRKV